MDNETEDNATQDPLFYDNLAKHISQGVLDEIGQNLSDAIEDDDASREVWKQIIKDGLDYLGIGSGRPNASMNMPTKTDIYAPTLLKNAINMTAKIHHTLFPANGFVSTLIYGEEDDEKQDRADRIENWFNYYFRNIAKEYIPDKKQAIWWCILTGSVFTKVYIDPVKKRPVGPYVAADDMIVAAGASSIEEAERLTYRFTVTERQLAEKRRTGQYIDVDLEEDDMESNSIKAKADMKVGIALPSMSEDHNKRYSLYECMTWLDIDGFEHMDGEEPSGKPLPYIVTLEKNSRKVISIYRNYDESDQNYERKNIYVQYKFLPGFGVYGFGLFHLMLGLAKAETQALSEYIRAAELANAPSLLHSPGTKQDKTQFNFNPGTVTSLNHYGANSLQETIYPLPFKEPPQGLFQVIQWITSAIDAISVAREISPENIPANMSATTMMGIMSTMHVLEDSVINGFYESLKEELGIFYKLFGEWLPEGEPYPFSVVGGDHAVMKDDFSPDVSIKPIVDPNISSQTMQLVQTDKVREMAAQHPEMYDLEEVDRRALKAMKVSNIDKLFKPKEPEQPPPPPERDPVTENQSMMSGIPTQVYKTQDHAAHKTVHQDLMGQLQQQVQAGDESKTPIVSALQAHIQSHDTFAYVVEMEARMGTTLPDYNQQDPNQDPNDPNAQTTVPPEMQDQIAQQAAQVVLQKQQEEQAANPPPPSSEEVMLKDIEMKKEANESRNQIDMQKLQLEEQKLQMEQQRMAFEQQKIQQEMQLEQMKADREESLEQMRAQRDTDIEHMKFEAQQQIEQMKVQIAMKEIELAEAKLNIEIQKEQSQSGVEMAKLQLEEGKSRLQAETKAFDATLRFNKDTDKGDVIDNIKKGKVK